MGKGESKLYSSTVGGERQEEGQELDFNGCRETIGFLSQALLEEHYDDHKGDFGNITVEQYIEKAQKFFASEKTKDIHYFYDVDGFLFKYDEDRVEFGICSPDKHIITFFRPCRGNRKRAAQYWERKAVENAK
jgi:hypothetical protein